MNQIEFLSLDVIQRHENNRMIGGFENAKLEELAASIKSHGVLQPIIVRPLPLGGEFAEGQEIYELVAGERRWRASRLAGCEAIPAIIRDLTDDAAVKIRTIENLQRENLHPLDEMANYQELIERVAYTPDQIAEEIGRSRAYVMRRLSLAGLVDKAREPFLNHEMTLSHALIVARLPSELQEEALTMMKDYNGNLKPGSQFARDVEAMLTLELSVAPWPMDWKTKDLRDCAGCPKRTGTNPSLFPELSKGDRCMDPDCHAAKMKAWIEKRKGEIDADVVLAHGSYDYDREDAEGIVDYYEYEKVKNPDDGYDKMALVLDGADAGHVVPIRMRGYDAPADSLPPEEQEEYAKEKKEREISNLKNRIIAKVVIEELEKETRGDNMNRAACSLIIYNALWEEQMPDIIKVPDLKDEEGDYLINADKASKWINSLTLEEIQEIARGVLFQSARDSYWAGYYEGLAEILALQYKTIEEESLAEATAAWEEEHSGT